MQADKPQLAGQQHRSIARGEPPSDMKHMPVLHAAAASMRDRLRIVVSRCMRHIQLPHLTWVTCLQSLQVVRYRCSKNSLSTEDKLHIMELCHRFDRAVNMGELEKVSQCFTDKGVVQSPKGTVQGRQQLVEYFKSTRPLAEGNRHLTCNIIVEPDGEQGAVATSYRILHKATNPPGLIASGIIEDKLVQVGNPLDGQTTVVFCVISAHFGCGSNSGMLLCMAAVTRTDRRTWCIWQQAAKAVSSSPVAASNH